ncbi:MAG: extracellular solute-binding protein, partial [Candidatus Promineifilaceae bacterium]
NNTLRVWIPPEIAARTDAGATTLADQIFAYDMGNSEVTVVVEQKRVRNSGGIMSYLRTGKDIAPDIMPDLVAIPTDLLPAMATENLIVPLGERVPEESTDALFPAALALGQPGEQFLGYPFALGSLPHLAYNSNVVTGTLPLTWERLVSEGDHRYVLAADGSDGALLALQFYLEAGGPIVDESGQPALFMDPLTEALHFVEDAHDEGLFAEQDDALVSTEQAWQLFLSGGGDIVQTTADHFLRQTTAGLPIAYTIIPGLDSPLTPLVDGWAWAVTTQDAQEQALALDLITELTASSNLAAWSEASQILPARRDAFAEWQGEEPYAGFIRQELERAQPLTVAQSGKLLTVLGDAVFQVVSGSATAEQAAAAAVEAMRS